MRKAWLWVALGAVVFVIAGAAFSVGRMAAMPQQSPKVEVKPPTKEERELQKLKIAASEGKLVEATPTPQGWVVRFEQEAEELSKKSLAEQAQKFFSDLARSEVEVARTSFEAKSSSLKDVWGNTLKDVPVARVELSQETFKRINWKGFSPDNFSRVADELWVHEIIERIEEQKKQQSQQQGGQGGSQQGGGSGQGQG